MRECVPGALEVIHRGNHLAAAVPRRRVLQNFLATVERANARGPANLVAAERVEVAADGLHVHGQVARALRAVHERRDAKLPRAGAEVGHGVERAEGVRDVDHREELHLGREQGIQLAQVEQAFVASDGDVAELRAGALGEHLPRHDVAVVLHLGEQDDVAGLDELPAPRVGDEVDAFGGAACEDDFLRAAGVEELPRPLPRRLEGIRRAVAQLVDATVHIRIVSLVVAHEGVNDRARLLRRRGVVKIHERMPMDLLVEDGEVGAERGPVRSRRRHENHFLATD